MGQANTNTNKQNIENIENYNLIITLSSFINTRIRGNDTLKGSRSDKLVHVLAEMIL